jgi:hypothetical protein
MRGTAAWIVAMAMLGCVGCARSGPTWYETVVQTTPPAPPHEEVADEVDLKVLPSRETAMRVLLRTRTFTDIAVYGEGFTPVQLKSFAVLLDQRDAPRIFRVLLERADAAGQMFALCGLYLVDRPHFDAQVGRFRSDRRRLSYWYGCVPSPTTVAELVQRRGAAIRVPLGHELPEEFYLDAGNRQYVDIAGGGWPEIFRTAVARMDANGDIRNSEPGLEITSDGSLFGGDETDETSQDQAGPDGLPGR